MSAPRSYDDWTRAMVVRSVERLHGFITTADGPAAAIGEELVMLRERLVLRYGSLVLDAEARRMSERLLEGSGFCTLHGPGATDVPLAVDPKVGLCVEHLAQSAGDDELVDGAVRLLADERDDEDNHSSCLCVSWPLGTLCDACRTAGCVNDPFGVPCRVTGELRNQFEPEEDS